MNLVCALLSLINIRLVRTYVILKIYFKAHDNVLSLWFLVSKKKKEQ